MELKQVPTIGGIVVRDYAIAWNHGSGRWSRSFLNGEAVVWIQREGSYAALNFDCAGECNMLVIDLQFGGDTRWLRCPEFDI